MNNLYYWITRILINKIIVCGAIKIWRSLFYLIPLIIFFIMLQIIFHTYIFEETPNLLGIVFTVLDCAFIVIIIARFANLNDYRSQHEPHLIMKFFTDCFRHDNEIDKRYKEQKSKNKKLKKEDPIKSRTEILDV